MNQEKLWTKDFTIITVGSTVSMLGNAVSGFAIGLLVLDITQSVFLYSLFMVVYNLPKLVMPILAGPYLDKYSRKKAIYLLDFISAGIYLFMFFMLQAGATQFILILAIAFLIGTLDSIYLVAYDSFYPNLVSSGNMSKAYSISSMLYPLAAIMVPVAAWVYERVGIAPLFLFNAVTFLFAAICETQVKAEEQHIQTENETKHSQQKGGWKQYVAEFKEGVRYIKGEKGLLIITSYFFVTILVSNANGTLLLPYFKETSHLGVQAYTYVMGVMLLGRLLGGGLHYAVKIPKRRKYMIAITVYLVLCIIEGTQLFFSVETMMLLGLITGILGVTSYNIRISATQDYLPDNHRARFNGTFQMVTTLGGNIGTLLAGVLGDFLPMREIIVAFACVNLLAVFLIMVRNREAVKGVYNRDL